LPWFRFQGVFNRDYDAPDRPEALAELWAVLTQTRLRTLPLLQLGSEPRVSATARRRHLEGGSHPALAFHLGAAALSDRDYEAAARFFAAAREEGNPFHPPRLLRAFALALAGRRDEALAGVLTLPAPTLAAHAQPWHEWLRDGLARAAAADAAHASRRGP
jgi:hypothetical protein